MTKIRYAVVGAGWIAQEAFLPAVKQTGNSEVVAIVSGNADKARRLAEFHGVAKVYDYSAFDAMAASGKVDAVYIATPNSSHCDFAVRAAKHGLHCLVEKPLAVTVAEAEQMVAASRKAGTYLMTAYRLHSDAATIKVAELIAQGAIGDVRHFGSVFSFVAALGNHRLKAEHWGGPLQDLGVYCVNAVRHVFGENPERVWAVPSFGHQDARFTEVEEGLAVTLSFSRGRMAQFYAGFGSDTIDVYHVLGTKGTITLNNGYRFAVPRRLTLQRDTSTDVFDFEETDNFSGMIAYFSDCIATRSGLLDDGTEGLADMLALAAIVEASKSGTACVVPKPGPVRTYGAAMQRSFPPAREKLLI